MSFTAVYNWLVWLRYGKKRPASRFSAEDWNDFVLRKGRLVTLRLGYILDTEEPPRDLHRGRR